MKLRVSFVVLAILSTVLTILTCAKYPTGSNTISLDKPVELWSAIGTMVAMALPALILCFFNYMTTRIISSILSNYCGSSMGIIGAYRILYGKLLGWRYRYYIFNFNYNKCFCNAHSGFIETKENVHKLKCIYLDYWTS